MPWGCPTLATSRGNITRSTRYGRRPHHIIRTRSSWEVVVYISLLLELSHATCGNDLDSLDDEIFSAKICTDVATFHVLTPTESQELTTSDGPALGHPFTMSMHADYHITSIHRCELGQRLWGALCIIGMREVLLSWSAPLVERGIRPHWCYH